MKHCALPFSQALSQKRIIYPKQDALCVQSKFVDWGQGCWMGWRVLLKNAPEGKRSFGKNLFVGCVCMCVCVGGGGGVGTEKYTYQENSALKNILIKKIQHYYHCRLSFK